MRAVIPRFTVLLAVLACCGAALAAGPEPVAPAALIEGTFEAGHSAFLAKDYGKALEILEPLAEAGDARAQVTVGIMYDYGHGVAKAPLQALEWYKKAALQDIPVVQHDLGVKYFRGTEIPQDYSEAIKWWRMAAENGLADSQYNLGLMYARGWGVSRDYQEALRWYREAAEQNHLHAQYLLALMYAVGEGVDVDYTKAAQWFRRAAEQGLPKAQYSLGVLMENGQGVEKNPTEAREWYRKAADQGLEQAVKKLAEAPPGSVPPIASSDKPAASQPADAIHREDWIAAQDPATYTLQVSTSADEQAIINLLRRLGTGGAVAYFRSGAERRARYTAIYGLFSSYNEAEAALAQLPGEVHKGKPWIRKFSVLQQHLKP